MLTVSRMYRSGPKTELCDTPNYTGCLTDNSPPNLCSVTDLIGSTEFTSLLFLSAQAMSEIKFRKPQLSKLRTPIIRSTKIGVQNFLLNNELFDWLASLWTLTINNNGVLAAKGENTGRAFRLKMDRHTRSHKITFIQRFPSQFYSKQTLCN